MDIFCTSTAAFWLTSASSRNPSNYTQSMKRKIKKIIGISSVSFLLFIIAGVIIAASKTSYLSLLQNAGGYNDKWDVDAPQFTYQQASDSNLVRVRTYFNLDSVAGKGDEISQIKNLMYYVHNLAPHDGNTPLTVSRNSISLIDHCKKENRGMNCRMLAITLNEFYLSMGFASRYVTCLPADSTDKDCHVINIVYSKDLNKWIWMDPSFAAYVTDENNQLLNIEEVRNRLVNNLPLVLNEDANWNNRVKQTLERYLKTYMAKNLYWLACVTESVYAVEDKARKDRLYVRLCPEGFRAFHISKEDYETNNPHYFWQSPNDL
jgi:hypothetical protein